jgi:hypothetical protein
VFSRYGPPYALSEPHYSDRIRRAAESKRSVATKVISKPEKEAPMNGWRGYSVRLEGAKYGVSFGSALAIAISYVTNHSILWAIIDGILSWLYVIYFVLFHG